MAAKVASFIVADFAPFCTQAIHLTGVFRLVALARRSLNNRFKSAHRWVLRLPERPAQDWTTVLSYRNRQQMTCAFERLP
jgi:hypothetical protein